MFNNILIANRGEIACRIIRACRELSIKTTAVYSDIDKKAFHVQKADSAVYIGPSPAVQSYLNIDSIIRAAKEYNCDAIHPGYGFLAENYKFARRCEDEKIIFIGPNSDAMKLLGSKIDSRIMMSKAGIPITPGMKNSSKDIYEFKKISEEIGYPVLIKAAYGGGGKGMRIVEKSNDLEHHLESAMRESLTSFGSDDVYIEKYLKSPRHIEFQVAADNHGNVIHLFERECSIQRRHQKIIEETPSTALNAELRFKMSEIAVQVIKTANYNNLGTVEFILEENKNFYFLEVNTRIQVEHPITEMVTGLDLIKLQIGIAAGENLPFKQDQIKQRGHAIECRIYAEDFENNFLPSPGKILFIKEPAGPGIRYDSGVYSGCDVPVFYDPILAKLISFGSSREEARKRMILALKDNIILGVKTHIPFLIKILDHPEFIKGNISTDFLQKHILPENRTEEEFNISLISAAYYTRNHGKGSLLESKNKISSPWEGMGKWVIGKK